MLNVTIVRHDVVQKSHLFNLLVIYFLYNPSGVAEVMFWTPP